MKTLLISLATAIALVGLIAYIVHRDPKASQISEALNNLKPESDLPHDIGAVGFLSLKKRHPDGEEGKDEFEHAYSVQNGIERLHQMEGFLGSFQKLTDLTRNNLSPSVLREIGNTDWEMQGLGFHNIPIIIEGTLLKQDYQLRQVEYKLAQLQSLGGDITQDELEQKRSAYAEATRKFQTFWDTKLPAD
jgi:hypothetical protein